jgi:hypothetical protein
MLYLRSSREPVARGMEARQFVGVIFECRPTARAVDKTVLMKGGANKSWQSRRGIFLTGRVGSFCGDWGGQRGKGGARRGMSRGGRAREGRKKRVFTELLKKRGWTSAPLYLSRAAH